MVSSYSELFSLTTNNDILLYYQSNIQLQMMVNLVETYNINRQRIEDVSQSLTFAAYVTWVIAIVILSHIAASHFIAGF